METEVIFHNVACKDEKPDDATDDPVHDGRKKDEPPDSYTVVDVSKAAKLQRALKWAGLKPVSWQATRLSENAREAERLNDFVAALIIELVVAPK